MFLIPNQIKMKKHKITKSKKQYKETNRQRKTHRRPLQYTLFSKRKLSFIH